MHASQLSKLDTLPGLAIRYNVAVSWWPVVASVLRDDCQGYKYRCTLTACSMHKLYLCHIGITSKLKHDKSILP